MYLVRVGHRTVNLGAPPDEAPPGKIRVSVYPGKIFDVGGDDAV